MKKYAEITRELALLGLQEQGHTDISVINKSKRSYKIRYRNSSLVLKIFDEKNFYDRELYALLVLGRNNGHCPSLINYDDKNNCILYEWVQGTTLYNALNKYSFRKLIRIFEGLGEELRRVHSIELHSSLSDYSDYKNQQIKNIEQVCSQIMQQPCFNKFPVIQTTIEEIRKKYSLFDATDQLSLIHNDLNTCNIIVKDSGLKAIIDYEQCSPGLCYADFIALKYYASSRLEKAFIRGYKKIYPDLYQEFTRYFFLCDILRNCLYCNQKNKSYFNYYLELLKKSYANIF